MSSVNKATLAKLYIKERKSIPDVAKALGLTVSTARKRLIDAGITLRSRADGVRAARHKLGQPGVKRTFSPEWKENIRAGRKAWGEKNAKGTSTKASGRVQITRGKNKHRMLHVELMERQIGRRLAKNEVVHHKDENPGNNDIGNLELMTRADHTRLHRRIQKKAREHGKR